MFTVLVAMFLFVYLPAIIFPNMIAFVKGKTVSRFAFWFTVISFAIWTAMGYYLFQYQGGSIFNIVGW